MRRPVISDRNRNPWQQISLFLDDLPKREARPSRFHGCEFVVAPALAAASKAGQAKRRTAAAGGGRS